MSELAERQADAPFFGVEASATEGMWCASCGEERWFELPDCMEGHGVDCPERCCLECGAAVLVEVLVEVPVRFAAVA